MTDTPHIDALANGGKILNSWYSGCPVCSGSRTALMTGRQYTRVGVPGVFGDSSTTGLPLNETTVGDQMKKAGYKTAIMGKWHLGQRPMFLPGARGFDTYMGIPYSDDMGKARRSPCPGQQACDAKESVIEPSSYKYTLEDDVHGTLENLDDLNSNNGPEDLSPLVFQSGGVSSTPGAQTVTGGYAANTTILEQPVDFTTLAPKYKDFVTGFIEESKADPFFLYMPFSHVHTTANNQPQKQYASCQFQNTSRRGAFGDALSEVDWLIGAVHDKLKSAGVEENTLILFTGGAFAAQPTTTSCFAAYELLRRHSRCLCLRPPDLLRRHLLLNRQRPLDGPGALWRQHRAAHRQVLRLLEHGQGQHLGRWDPRSGLRVLEGADRAWHAHPRGHELA